MREKQIENKLASEVKKAGGIALKFVSPSFDGMPDRLVLIPDGHIAFVELKAPGKKPRPLQLARHRLLRSLGFQVYVIDSVEQLMPSITSRPTRWLQSCSIWVWARRSSP